MSDTPNGKEPRKRSLTSLTLNWMADRLRKAELVKKQIKSGTYKVKSEEIAAAIMNEEMKGS